MVIIAGHWELGCNTPIKEVDLWKFMLRDFGIDKFYMFPISGISDQVVIEKCSLKEILEENKEHTVVMIDERANVELQDFKHPENAIYITGIANDKSLLEGVKSVKVKTVQNKGLLWPHQALGIVLYDRLIKNGISSN